MPLKQDLLTVIVFEPSHMNHCLGRKKPRCYSLDMAGEEASGFCRKSLLMPIIRSLKPRQGYPMISFKQRHFKKEMIVMRVRW